MDVMHSAPARDSSELGVRFDPLALTGGFLILDAEQEQRRSSIRRSTFGVGRLLHFLARCALLSRFMICHEHEHD